MFNICWRFCRRTRWGKVDNCIMFYIIGPAAIYRVGYIINIIVIALWQHLQAQKGQGPIFPDELADAELSYPTRWLSSLKCVENGLSMKSADSRLLSLPPCLSACDLTLTAVSSFLPWMYNVVAPRVAPKEITCLLFLIYMSKMMHHFDLCWRENLFKKERIKEK